MILEKLEDLLEDVVGGIGGGRIGNDTEPDHDGTETPDLLLSQPSVGEKAGRVDRRPVNPPSLDQLTDLGTDSVPDITERGLNTPRIDLTARWGYLPLGLRKGIVRQSDR